MNLVNDEQEVVRRRRRHYPHSNDDCADNSMNPPPSLSPLKSYRSEEEQSLSRNNHSNGYYEDSMVWWLGWWGIVPIWLGWQWLGIDSGVSNSLVVMNIYLGLVLYGCDLANVSYDTMILNLWLSFGASCMGSWYWDVFPATTKFSCWLLYSCTTALLTAWVICIGWLHRDRRREEDEEYYISFLHQWLCGALPIVLSTSTVLLLHELLLPHITTIDFVLYPIEIILPLIWSIVFLFVWHLCSSIQSIRFPYTNNNNNHNQKQQQSVVKEWSTHPFDAHLQSYLLVLLPIVYYIVVIFPINNYDDFCWNDLILIFTFPYSIHWLYVYYQHQHQHQQTNPTNFYFKYFVPSKWFFPSSSSFLRYVLPISIITICFASLQHGYILPALRSMLGLIFLDNKNPNLTHRPTLHRMTTVNTTLMVRIWHTVCGTLSTAFFLLAAWFLKRPKKSPTMDDNDFHNYLGGEHHQDIFITIVAVAAAFGTLALGVTFSNVCMNVMLAVSITFFITSRMLRYWILFLACTVPMVINWSMYRMFHLPINLIWPFPHSSISLNKFLIISYCITISTMGLLVGLVWRSSGGKPSNNKLKRMNLPGWCLLSYTWFLSWTEIALLTEPLPTILQHHHLQNNNHHHIYEPTYAYVSSIALIMLSFWLYRQKAITKAWVPSVVSCLSVAKFSAILFVDMHPHHNHHDNDDEDEHAWEHIWMIFSFLATFLLLWIIRAPHVHILVNHPKDCRLYELKQQISIYCGFYLPLAITLAVPLVLQPWMDVIHLNKHSTKNNYYYVAMMAASMDHRNWLDCIGYILIIWGATTLSMFNHVINTTTSENKNITTSKSNNSVVELWNQNIWRKLSAASFVLGLVWIMVVSINIIDVSEDNGDILTFLSLSSRGLEDHFFTSSSTHNNHAGYGLLVAVASTLLVLTGPLSLRHHHRQQRSANNPSSRNNHHRRRLVRQSNNSHQPEEWNFARLISFSLLFGCGMAWFVTITCLTGTITSTGLSSSFSLALTFMKWTTILASMCAAFLGTIATVLAFASELKYYQDVQDVTRVLIISFPLLLFIPMPFRYLFVTSSDEDDKDSNSSGTTGSILISTSQSRIFSTSLHECVVTIVIIFAASFLALAVAHRYRKEKNKATRTIGNMFTILTLVCVIFIIYSTYGLTEVFTGSSILSFNVPSSAIWTLFGSTILLLLEGEPSDKRPILRSKIKRINNYNKSSNYESNGNLFWERLSHWMIFRKDHIQFLPLCMTTLVYVLTSLYIILLRGCFREINTTALPTSFERMVHMNIKNAAATTDWDDVANVANHSFLSSNDQRLMMAKLDATGFCTTSQGSFSTPLIHLLGVFIVLPNYCLCISHLFSIRISIISSQAILYSLPACMFTIIFCNGIPYLRLFAVLCLGIGMKCYTLLQQKEHHIRTSL